MDWLLGVSLVMVVLLGGTVAVLSAMLNSARRRQKQDSRAGTKPPDTSVRQPETETPAAPGIDDVIEREFLNPVEAGRVRLFRVTLENDRISPAMFTGFRPPGTPGTMRFESCLERIHPADRQMFRTAVIDAMTRQKPLELVFRLTDEGFDRYYYMRARTFPGITPGAVDLVGAFFEISALMHAQAERDDWLKTLEELNDASPFGAWACNADGVMTLWNQALEKMTGLQAESVVGFNRESIHDPTFAAVVRGSDDIGHGEAGFRITLTGDEGIRQFRVTPVRIRRGGHIDHTFGIVSQECQAARIGKSAEMEALGRLTAGIAHDFANLVHIITGYSDIVAQDLGDDDSRLPPFVMDDLSQIQNAAARADELVRQLLLFCSRESLNTTKRDLNDVLKRFMGLMTRILGEEITLRFHPRVGLHHAVADTGMIERILLKIMLLLKESLPDGGVVVISTLNVTVEPGWPVGDLEPADYVKLSISTDTVGWGREVDSDEGSGDGESVRSMMATLGGRVNLHESPDLGTTVSLYFKSADEGTARSDTADKASAPDSDEAGAPAERNRKGTVLVVEDDIPVRRLTAKTLVMAGHVVLEAADGHEAIALFNQDPDRIDLLITDIIMPGMNGRQVCDELKRTRPDLPVLFCSGYSSDLLKNEYMLNIQGLVIQKPYRASDLVAAAARLLAATPAKDHRQEGDTGDNPSDNPSV